jgi:hypothetical protein
MVTSPNMTLSVQNVPVRMAGVAGGALQTAQRIGSAIGTALLATVLYRILATTSHRYPSAAAGALLCALGVLTLAWLLAVGDALWRRSGTASPPRTAPDGEYKPHPPTLGGG